MYNLVKNKQNVSREESKKYANDYFLKNINNKCTLIDYFPIEKKLNTNCAVPVENIHYENNFENNIAENDNYLLNETQLNNSLDNNNEIEENQSDLDAYINNDLFNKNIPYDNNFDFSNIEEVSKDDFVSQENIINDNIDNNEQMDIYSLLDEFNIGKELLLDKKKNNKYDLNYLTKNKIKEMVLQKYGHCDEKILDDLHSKAIANNWKEIDIQK